MQEIIVITSISSPTNCFIIVIYCDRNCILCLFFPSVKCALYHFIFNPKYYLWLFINQNCDFLSLYLQFYPIHYVIYTHSWWGVLAIDTPLCDKDCQWLVAGTPVSCTNKTDHHDITEILLVVALSTINLNLKQKLTIND
jgi:hypothetical protein